jgi:hypothetical protein
VIEGKMNPLETILAFLVVMGVIAIPLAAVITRRNSATGEALADRIRRRNRLREAAQARKPGNVAPQPAAIPSENTQSLDPDQLAILDANQTEIRELTSKIDFLQRLVEEQKDSSASD